MTVGTIFSTHNKRDVLCWRVLILTPKTHGSDTPHTPDIGTNFNTQNNRYHSTHLGVIFSTHIPEDNTLNTFVAGTIFNTHTTVY